MVALFSGILCSTKLYIYKYIMNGDVDIQEYIKCCSVEK